MLGVNSDIFHEIKQQIRLEIQFEDLPGFTVEQEKYYILKSDFITEK